MLEGEDTSAPEAEAKTEEKTDDKKEASSTP